MLSLSLSPSPIRPSVFMEPSAERVRTPEQTSCSEPKRSPSPLVHLRRKKAYSDSDSTITTPNSYNPAKRIKEEDYSTHDDTSSRESEERSSSISQTEALWFLPDHQRRGIYRDDNDIISSAPPFPTSEDISNNKNKKASSLDVIERETRLPFLPPAPSFSSYGFSPRRRPSTLPRTSNHNHNNSAAAAAFFLQPSPKSPLSQSMESMKIHSFLNRPKASLKVDHDESNNKNNTKYKSISKGPFFVPKPSSSFHPIRCLDERPTEIGPSSLSKVKTTGLQEAHPLPRRPPARQDRLNNNILFQRQEGSDRQSHFRSNSLNESMIIDHNNNDMNQQELSISSDPETSILARHRKRDENKIKVCAFSPFVRSNDKSESKET